MQDYNAYLNDSRISDENIKSVIRNNLTYIKSLKNGDINYSESIRMLNEALSAQNLTKYLIKIDIKLKTSL